MADNSSATGIVAIFAIVFMLAIATLIAWRMGVFNTGRRDQGIDVKFKTN
jgi:hypothetical protein